MLKKSRSKLLTLLEYCKDTTEDTIKLRCMFGKWYPVFIKDDIEVLRGYIEDPRGYFPTDRLLMIDRESTADFNMVYFRDNVLYGVWKANTDGTSIPLLEVTINKTDELSSMMYVLTSEQ